LAPGLDDGLEVMPLHQHEDETVALVKWAPTTQFNAHKYWFGEEIFALEGTFYDKHDSYPAGGWLRGPHLSKHCPYTKEDGALIYVKVGHLHANKNRSSTRVTKSGYQMNDRPS